MMSFLCSHGLADRRRRMVLAERCFRKGRAWHCAQMRLLARIAALDRSYAGFLDTCEWPFQTRGSANEFVRQQPRTTTRSCCHARRSVAATDAVISIRAGRTRFPHQGPARAGAARNRPADQRTRISHHRRPVRLRQVHADEPDRRSVSGLDRRDPISRQAPQRRQPLHRLRHPGRQPLSVAHAAQEHRVSSGAARRAGARAPRAVAASDPARRACRASRIPIRTSCRAACASAPTSSARSPTSPKSS